MKKRKTALNSAKQSGMNAKIERLLKFSRFELDKDVSLIDRAASELTHASSQKMTDYLRDCDSSDEFDLGETAHAIALEYVKAQTISIEAALRDLNNQLRTNAENKERIKRSRRKMRSFRF